MGSAPSGGGHVTGSAPVNARVSAAFDAAGRNRPLIIPFVTAGFPELDATVPIVEALARAGADMVEIGVPFSDPLADGPTIQRASEVALANGMTLRRVLEVVRTLRAAAASEKLPLILMGYCNPIFAYGLEVFLDDAVASGVDGLIVPDLPPEEAHEYRQGCVDRGLAAILLVAPNAPDERIELVDRMSTGFSYCVTVTGVTGARGAVHERTLGFLQRVRALSRQPFVVGFGVKGPQHVKQLGAHADGVVVGSALIDAMSAASDPAAAGAGLVAALRAAADELASSPEPAR